MTRVRKSINFHSDLFITHSLPIRTILNNKVSETSLMDNK